VEAAAARGDFDRYVAIGTSVSEGWASDGVVAPSQLTSWPSQLGRLGGRQISLPLIAFPGCGAPLAAPLAAGLRISGEPASAPFLSRVCAPNVDGVTLPTQNVAISGARTDQALFATPENPDPSYAPLYARTLAPGQSQVTAMEAQRPRLVSVELGANEVLGARDGAYVPGQTVVPVAFWAPVYDLLLDRVAAAAPRALLVGLISDVRSFPSFRTGAELWRARATFLPFNVAVSTDCIESRNIVFVPVRVPLAAAQGAAAVRAGQGPVTFSCANAPPTAPDGSVIRDFVLGPAEVALLNAQLVAMTTIIRRQAEARGFAYFALSALYEDANRKPPFDAFAMLTSPEPYGPLISLDGIHPSAAGSAVLANAAAQALNRRYRIGLPTTSTSAPLLAAR
jgi:lysophospholipase L1-like esterase